MRIGLRHSRHRTSERGRGMRFAMRHSRHRRHRMLQLRMGNSCHRQWRMRPGIRNSRHRLGAQVAGPAAAGMALAP